MKVLVVEDDEKVLSYIRKGLDQEGHNVDTAPNGKDGLFLATTETYDVMIIDRMLPELDGLTIIKTLRGTNNNTPVLILSAMAEVDDKVQGLKSGGDDYLTKPFAFAELMARIEVLAKRQDNNANEQEVNVAVGDLTLDLLGRKVTRGEQTIDLQSREFRLLDYMIKNKDKVVTRTMLLENVWDYHFDPQTNVIDVHISRLRSKIDKGFDHQLIKTVRGAGYMISAN